MSSNNVAKQVFVPIAYCNVEIETELRLDLLVNEMVIIEIKTVEHLLPVHEAQLLTYMKLLKKPQGLLIQFLYGQPKPQLKTTGKRAL